MRRLTALINGYPPAGVSPSRERLVMSGEYHPQIGTCRMGGKTVNQAIYTHQGDFVGSDYGSGLFRRLSAGDFRPDIVGGDSALDK